MTIEERLDQLEQDYNARIAKLELELAKEKAVTQIQNCMGRYAYMHTAGMHTRCLDCFANGDPELSIEIGPSGIYRGPDAAQRIYDKGHNQYENARIGFMAEHTLTTPVIEVADDLQTAKALWISPGHETDLDPETGKYEGDWMWGRYAMDFKCIDGQWKIWHFQMFPTFRCDYYHCWTDTEANDRVMARERDRLGLPFYPPMFPAAGDPDEPTSFFEEYARDRIMKFWPQPPEAYETFEGTQSMVGAIPEGAPIYSQYGHVHYYQKGE